MRWGGVWSIVSLSFPTVSQLPCLNLPILGQRMGQFKYPIQYYILHYLENLSLEINEIHFLSLSPGQQLRKSSTIHLRVQHPQHAAACLSDAHPLPPSHLLLPTGVSHAAPSGRGRGGGGRRWGGGGARQPRDHEAWQALVEGSTTRGVGRAAGRG